MRRALAIPQGIFPDDTSLSRAGRWRDANLVRFHRGQAQTVGGWERQSLVALTGVCRTVMPWTDNTGALNLGFGTHSALQVSVGGGLYTITPTLAVGPATLAANPLSVTSGSPVVTVSHLNHGLATGTAVAISGATAVGGITPNGTFGITVTGPNAYTYTYTANATSTATGGGSAVVVQAQTPFSAGQIDGTGGAGYGTGAFGVGGYSQPSTADYFPRTWSLSVYGQWLIASPRAGTIYIWQNNTADVAQPLTNAPAVCTCMLVTPTRQVMALGCSDALTGVFNPLLVRYSDLANPMVWATTATNQAGDYTLSGDGGGRIVGARLIGRYVFCWTDNGLYLGSYVGSATIGWKFDRIGDKCGLIGPNAAVVVGQAAYWMAPSGQFYTCALGGSPTVLPSSVQDGTFANIASSQRDKIVASSTAAFAEVRWDYPDQRDGLENSRYVVMSLAEADADGRPAWSRGIMARTAYVDAGAADSPVGVTADGKVYWHERGYSADGGALTWFIESADQSLGDLDKLFRVNGVWPDVQGQIGPLKLSVIMRMRPQSAERTSSWMLAPNQPKRDFRATGRLGRVRFDGSSVPSFARMGSPVFDLIPTGGQ